MADLFDVVVARKLSGGGGGGSGDFSIANVTFNNPNGTTGYYSPYPFVTDNGISILNHEVTETTETHSVALYKGKVEVYDTMISAVSGDASMENNLVTITGDCTITIS